MVTLGNDNSDSGESSALGRRVGKDVGVDVGMFILWDDGMCVALVDEKDDIKEFSLILFIQI